jgi:hypothetical protein
MDSDKRPVWKDIFKRLQEFLRTLGSSQPIAIDKSLSISFDEVDYEY